MSAPTDVVISTKAPTYMVRHPRHVSYLLHTLRVFTTASPASMESDRRATTAAALIHRLTKRAAPVTGARPLPMARSPTSPVDADAWWRQIAFTLHPPPALDAFFHLARANTYSFRGGSTGETAGSADPRVRVARYPVAVAGSGGMSAPPLRRTAIPVSASSVPSPSGSCWIVCGRPVVPFVPVQEDYGLITMGLQEPKPITCAIPARRCNSWDSVTGFVVEPSEQALADRLFLSIA